MEDEVPGIFIRMAGILPPKPPPVKIAVRNNISSIKSIYRVSGRKIAIAMDICKPGIATKIKPIKMPGITINQTDGSEKSKEKTANNIIHIHKVFS